MDFRKNTAKNTSRKIGSNNPAKSVE
ncbi:MAG: hypothetical protein H6Q23_1831, partial [Bacteroidetes bacterium]|nr:hypothetical protein [Bacteroidota bacterium]